MMTNFKDMAPEDIFAMGIRKGLEMVKNMGRDGDTEIVHVNEDEKEALEDMGGRGSINPASGLREYPPAGADIEGSGRGRDPTGGGGNQRDDAQGRSAAARTQETRAISGQEAQAGGGGTSSNPSSSGAGSIASDMDAQKGQTQSNPPDERSLGERLAAGLEAAFTGGNRFGRPSGADPGFLGGLVGMAPGVGAGMAVSRGLQAAGIPNSPKEPGELGTDEYAGQRDEGVLSPGRKPVQQGNKTPAYAWTRPGSAPTAPAGLGFDAGMTPLQQRAAIATGGTNADAGIYRDPAIVDFYRNLATYSLTQPGGAPATGAAPLPVELQYLTQMGAQPGNDVETFLTALAGL